MLRESAHENLMIVFIDSVRSGIDLSLARLGLEEGHILLMKTEPHKNHEFGVVKRLSDFMPHFFMINLFCISKNEFGNLRDVFGISVPAKHNSPAVLPI